MINIQRTIPLYSLFVLFLIILGGYIAELLPCKLQRVFKENIYLKHFFCLLILIFLINITNPAEKKVELSRIILKSMILYIFFIFIIKTNYKFFIGILILLCFIYLLELKKQEYSDDIEKSEKNNNLNELKVLSIKKKLIY